MASPGTGETTPPVSSGGQAASPACPATCSSRWGSWLALFGGAVACSSCCLIQLVLNALTFGCAGFSFLAPLRGAFRYIALVGAMNIFMRGRQPLKWKVLGGSLAVCMIFSEDILGAYNRGSLKLPGAGGFGEMAASTPLGGSPPPDLVLNVPGMRCEACATKIKRAVEGGFPGASAECAVNLRDKSVAVRAVKPGVSIASSEVVALIEQAGFAVHTEATTPLPETHERETPPSGSHEKEEL